MPKPWSEIEQSPGYTNLESTDQVRAQQLYFDEVVKPKPAYRKLSAPNKLRANNLFFGIQDNNLNTIGQTYSIEEDLSDPVNILTDTEVSSLKKKGPIGWWEAALRQKKGDLPPFSLTPVVRNAKLLLAVNRQKADEYDSELDRQRDKDLLTTFLKKTQEESVRGFTMGAQIYTGVSNLPGFMLEFMVTGPFASLGKKAVFRGVGEIAEKQLVAFVATAVAATTVGAVARSSVMYNRYIPKFAERQIFANVALTDTGEAILKESTEKPAISAMKAFADVVIESISEELGATLTKGFKVVGAGIGKVFPKKLGVAFMKAYRKFKPSGKVTDMFTKAGYHGILEEMGEERIGDLMRAVTGVTVQPGEKVDLFDRLIKAIPNAEQLLVEAGVFSVPGVINYATQKAYNRLIKQGKKVSVKEVDEQLSQTEKEAVDEQLKDPKDIRSLFTEQELDEEIARDEELAKLEEADVEVDQAKVEAAIAGRREFDKKISGEKVISAEEEKELVPQFTAVRNQIDKIEDKIAEFEQKNEKIPSSLIKRRDAAFQVLETLGVPKTVARKKGVSVARILGQFDKQITISEAKALRRLVRAEAGAARTAAIVARRKERGRIISIFKAKAVTAATVKNDLVKFIKQTIPLRDALGKEINDRGKLLSLIEKTKTKPGLQKAFKKVNQTFELIQKEDTIKVIKSDTKKALASGKISVDYRKQIEDLVDLVDFTKVSKKKIKKLESLKEFVTRSLAEGKDVTLPIGVFKRLERLFKTPLTDMPLSGLKLLQNDIEDLISLGKFKQLTREKILLLSQQRILKDLEAQGAKAIHTINQELPALGERLSVKSRFHNAANKAIGGAQHLGEVIMPMDYFFDFLDDLKDGAGVLSVNFKQRIDIANRGYLKERIDLSEEVMEYVNTHKLDDRSFQRVGVFAISLQENGVAKLLNSGITKREISELKLTKTELGMHALMRKRLDELAPQIRDMLAKVYNRPFGKVKNYFSFLTDYDAMTKAELAGNYSELDLLLDMVTGNAEEFGQERKNPNLTFAEKRVKGTKQKVKINALEVYLKHIDRATYAINMSESLKLLNGVARSKKMKDIVGDKGQEYLTDWLTTLARNGMSGDVAFLDFFRRNISTAQFAFKISTAVLQGTAILDGAAMIGTWSFRGMKDIATSLETRNFVLNNFVEIRARIGGDAEFRDFGSKTTLDKINTTGFYALKKIDGLTAASVGFGAYRQFLAERNIPLDFNNPNQEAIIHAERIVRLTQASAQAKDLPIAFMSKQLTGSVSLNRALFQFQTFLLTRWQLFRHETIRYGVGQRDIGRGANVIFWLMLANYAEYGLRTASNTLVDTIFGIDDEDEEENAGFDMFMIALGNIPYVSMGVSFFGYGSNPVPTFDIMADMVDAVKKAQRSTNEQTKLKWLVRFTTEFLAAFKRVPRVFGKWAEKYIETYE